jgi:uncharacterized OB-fold protein
MLESSEKIAVRRPYPTDQSEVYGPYFRGLGESRIVIQRCVSCRTKHWPPREMCGVCNSEDIEWIGAPLTGEVYTFTVSYRAFHPAFLDSVPYGVVSVDLGDGVIVFGEYGGEDVEQIRCGMPVEAEFFTVDDGVTLLRWIPSEHNSDQDRATGEFDG